MKKGILASIGIMSAAAVLSAGIVVAGAADAPKLKGKAYVAGHGGHLAVLDLATGELDRIVITGAGGETEGKIAGLELDPGHKESGGGTHGQALVGRNLYVGLLNGKMMKYNLDKNELTDLGQVGKKFCGTVVGPNGNLYCEDMADGNVYVFDPSKDKAADVIPAGMSVCGIGWDKGDKNVFISDMVQGKVFVFDWKTKKKTDTIEVGTFIHQGRTNPKRTEFWVTAPNEFVVGEKGPVPASVAGKGKSEMVIIDMAKKKVKDRIDMTAEQAFPHDLAFTPDGKYALVTARTYGDDSIMLTVDTKTHKILNEVSLCKGCHDPAGIKVTIDQGSPLLCGIEVDWSAKK
jgi:DNA-binding beta-propeller fold protein YncE